MVQMFSAFWAYIITRFFTQPLACTHGFVMHVLVSDRRDDNFATASAQDTEEFNVRIGITAEANGVVRRETRNTAEEHRTAEFSSA